MVELPLSASMTEELVTPALIEPERVEALRHWLDAFVAVEFDQDIGPSKKAVK